MSRSALLDQTSNVVNHLDADKNIIYTQSQGGALAVGLMFGPLGVLANMKMVEAKTKADTALLINKLDVKPRAMFADAAQKAGLVIGTSPQAARLTPYLYVSKVGEGRVLVSAALIVEQPSTADKWVGKYMFQTPRAYTLEQLSSLDANGSRELNQAVATGFSRLVQHLRDEKPGQAEFEKKIVFNSRMLFPVADLELAGSLVSDETDLVWLRTVGGVYALRKTDVSYQPAK